MARRSVPGKGNKCRLIIVGPADDPDFQCGSSTVIESEGEDFADSGCAVVVKIRKDQPTHRVQQFMRDALLFLLHPQEKSGYASDGDADISPLRDAYVTIDRERCSDQTAGAHIGTICDVELIAEDWTRDETWREVVIRVRSEGCSPVIWLKCILQDNRDYSDIEQCLMDSRVVYNVFHATSRNRGMVPYVESVRIIGPKADSDASSRNTSQAALWSC